MSAATSLSVGPFSPPTGATFLISRMDALSAVLPILGFVNRSQIMETYRS